MCSQSFLSFVLFLLVQVILCTSPLFHWIESASLSAMKLKSRDLFWLYKLLTGSYGSSLWLLSRLFQLNDVSFYNK